MTLAQQLKEEYAKVPEHTVRDCKHKATGIINSLKESEERFDELYEQKKNNNNSFINSLCLDNTVIVTPWKASLEKKWGLLNPVTYMLVRVVGKEHQVKMMRVPSGLIIKKGTTLKLGKLKTSRTAWKIEQLTEFPVPKDYLVDLEPWQMLVFPLYTRDKHYANSQSLTVQVVEVVDFAPRYTTKISRTFDISTQNGTELWLRSGTDDFVGIMKHGVNMYPDKFNIGKYYVYYNSSIVRPETMQEFMQKKQFMQEHTELDKMDKRLIEGQMYLHELQKEGN